MNKTQSKTRFKHSKIKTIVFSALLVAIEIVLNRFCSINTFGWKIGFSFVPVVVAALLYGPTMAAIINALSDFIGAILFPFGPYFPGFTVCAAIMGFVYGIFLYRKPENEDNSNTIGGFAPFKNEKISLVKHILPPVLINSIVIGLFINTIWVSILYGSKTFIGWFIYRLPEYAILIPVNLILIPVLIKLCGKLKKFTK